MGCKYSAYHAAVLADQLPVSARVNTQATEGVSMTDLLLGRIEHNTRIICWQSTEDGREGRNFPSPLLDFSASGAMDIDSMREFLSRERREVEDGG